MGGMQVNNRNMFGIYVYTLNHNILGSTSGSPI